MWAVSAPLQQLACLKLPHRALRLPLSEEQQQLLLCPGLNGEVYGEAGLGSCARVRTRACVCGGAGVHVVHPARRDTLEAVNGGADSRIQTYF
jgi:hypothetical protein